MSGHSHYATIKHKKGAADAQRSSIFSKLARELAVAAREGGGDPATNPRLRAVIDKARSFNMPTDNIERAVNRGTGRGAEAELQKILLEAYGPGNIAMLIEGITDNKNRTLGEVKQILQKHQGKLVEGGAVKWMFEQKGVIQVAPGELTKEGLELAVIEAGAQDTSWDEGKLFVYTQPKELDQVKKSLEEKGVKAEGAQLEWVPKEPMEVPQNVRDAAEKLFEELDENDGVQEIFSNIKW